MVKTLKLQGSQKPLPFPKILVYNEQKDLPLSTSLVREVILFLLKELKVTTHEVAVHFVRESKICHLHETCFNDPSVTDCITFPMDAPSKKEIYHVLGEAFICPKTAVLYANKHKTDPYCELYRYLVHCILHLIGYTDTDPKERARMKRKENTCLKKVLQKARCGIS